MNFFSVCLLEVFFLGLNNFCVAKLLVRLEDDVIAKLYLEKKVNASDLKYLKRMKQPERLRACRNLFPGKTFETDAIIPHIFNVQIPGNLIPKSGPQISMTDIAIRCVPHSKSNNQEFILSYGFAQYMFFVSIPVGEKNMKLIGYMYSQPELEDTSLNSLQSEFFKLHKKIEDRTYIERKKDIEALTNYEKKILCASVLDIYYYKGYLHYTFTPIPEDEDYDYRNVSVYIKSKDEIINTDCLICPAKTVDSEGKNANVVIGVTPSNTGRGVVYILRKNENTPYYYINNKLNNVAVLVNPKFAGEHKGILVFKDFRT